MKQRLLVIGIILAFLFCNPLYAASSDRSENSENSGEKIKSFHELKLETLEYLKYKNDFAPIAPPEWEEEDVYLILGISSFAAFVLSITVFKQEIFNTLPLAFFGAGVLFTILAN